MVTGWWSATVIQRTRGNHGGGPGVGAGAAGQRQAHRSGHWGAETVRFGDPARVGTQVAAGGRGAVPNRVGERHDFGGGRSRRRHRARDVAVDCPVAGRSAAVCATARG